MGGSIGQSDSNTWKPLTMEKRKEDMKKRQTFIAPLNSSLNHEKSHDRELAFMAGNGIRQIVYPRIGEYADRQRPEPVHNEINAWKHPLNYIYQEALRSGLTEVLLEILSLPLQASDALPRVSKQFNRNDASVVPEVAGDRADSQC